MVDGGARQRQHNSWGKVPNSETERTEQTENSKRQAPRRQYNALSFPIMIKMIEEDTQPQIVVQKFTDENTGLKHFLENNSSNWEAIELILAVLGQFCEKRGVALFHNAFIRIVQLLAEKLIFFNLDSVVLNIPKSRANNLGTTEERLRRLVQSISYVTTEMLTVMPGLACDFLREQFFVDICALKNMPSISRICQMSTCDAFSTLEEGADRLKVGLCSVRYYYYLTNDINEFFFPLECLGATFNNKKLSERRKSKTKKQTTKSAATVYAKTSKRFQAA